MPEPTKNDEAEWYSAEKLQQLLEYYVADNDNTVVTAAFSTEGELKQNLKQIQGNWQQLVIPLNVNALSGQLGEDTNHWVGVHISYGNDNFGQAMVVIRYIDPMGRLPIDSGIRDILVSSLPGFTIRVEKPLDGKAIQYVEQSENELQGNTDDCGPMLVYAMACLSRGLLQKIPTISSAEASRSLGSFLRESFSKNDDFDKIHKTAVSVNTYRQGQSSVELDSAFVEIETDSGESKIKRGDYQQNSDVIVPVLPKAEHREYQISENKGNQQLILDAARTGKVERMQLLEKQGINLNEGTRDGYSILHYAVVNGMHESGLSQFKKNDVK
jgi:hypothetical protein